MAIALIADVQDESSLKACCEIIIKAYGKIDGLVNAAGGNVPEAVLQPVMIFFNEYTWHEKGNGCQFMGYCFAYIDLWKRIAENGGGSIVNISSVS